MERTLLLPATLVAGGFTLALLGDAGESMAQTFILQGEATHCWDTNGNGVCDGGEDVDGGGCSATDCRGPQGIQGPPGDAGDPGAPGLACWDTNGDGTATLPAEDTNADGVVDVEDCRPNPDCPAGFLRDATETSFVLCYDPATSMGADEMVRVGDFWVDRHESSVWANADCTGTQYGATTGDDYPATFPDTGDWSAPLYACSVAGVTPSRMVTWFQAQQSCNLAGKDLCTNEQWQAAATGTSDPGTFDGDGGGPCNTSSGSGAPRQTGQAAGFCTSAWGADDMVGNLWEWAGDWHVAGRTWQTGDEQTTSPWPAAYQSDRTWNLNGRANSGSAWMDGLPGATLRGGGPSNGTNAGVYAMGVDSGPSASAATVGFRCCRRR